MIVCENKKCKLSYSFKKGSMFEYWLFRSISSDGNDKHYYCDPKCYQNQTNLKISEDVLHKWNSNREKLLSEIDSNHKFISHKKWFYDNYVKTLYEEVN